MSDDPTIDFKAGLYLDQQKQAEKALRAMPADTMLAMAADHAVLRVARQQEVKRLIGKHGDAHPRVREKIIQAELDAKLSEIIDREADRLVKTSVPHEAGQMVVHGHVSDATGRAAPKLKVELADERSGKAIGRAVTDRFGYFRIAIEGQATRISTDGTIVRPTGEPAVPKDRDLHLLLRIDGEDENKRRQVIAMPDTTVYVDVVLARSGKEKDR